MRPTDSRSIAYFELFLILILLVFDSGFVFLYSYLAANVAFFGFVFGVSAVAFLLLYSLSHDRASWSSELHALFSISLFCYVMQIAASGDMILGALVKLLSQIQSLGLWFVLFIPLLFISSISIYFLRKERRSDSMAKYALLAVLFLILVFYFFFLLKGIFVADDEEVLKLTSVAMLLNGTNPYAASISLLLSQHIGSVGATFTTTNRIIGNMDYPALFFLAFVPFYFAAQPAIASLDSVYMPLQFTIFLFLLLLVFARSLKHRQLMRPSITFLLIFVLAAISLTSATVYLMLALMLLAYTEIDSKYAWIFIGLCLSIQQELWLPAVLLLAYSFNSRGMRRGLRNTLGSAAVFLLFNGYFILQNPGAFFGSILGTLNQPIIPFNPSVISFALLKVYPIPLPAYSVLFAIISLLVLVVSLYFNRKELIPLLSIIPFLFIDHVLTTYYAFLIFIFVFALSVSSGRHVTGSIERWLRGHRQVFAAAFTLLVMIAVAFVYVSHVSYQNGFSISVVNQTLLLNSSANVSVLRASVVHGNLSNSTVYLLAFTYGGASASFAGIGGQGIIGDPQQCKAAGYECTVNVNKLSLNGTSPYNLTVTIPWAGKAGPVERASLVIYNGPYFYAANSAGNATSPGSG